MSTFTLISGFYDDRRVHWRGANQNTWADQTSWSTWLNWAANPTNVVLQIDDDLLEVDVRVPTLEISYEGTRTIQLKISDTGAFAGEETTINFLDAQTYSVPAGRYYRWTITVEPTTTFPVPYLFLASTQYTQTSFTTEIYRNIDTSTLGGTVDGRIVTTTSASIHSVNITTHDTTNYVDRAYSVPDTFSVSTISPVPGIVSKNPLTIVLRDYYGVPVDGIVDLTVRGAPGITLQLDGGVIIS